MTLNFPQDKYHPKLYIIALKTLSKVEFIIATNHNVVTLFYLLINTYIKNNRYFVNQYFRNICGCILLFINFNIFVVNR